MKGTRFDRLIKRLATTPLTRANALRGLAASVATLTGVGLLTEPGAAKKDRVRKIWICHRTSATDPGVTKRREKSKVKKELKRHAFDTRGRCSAAGAGTELVCPPVCPTCQACDAAIAQCVAVNRQPGTNCAAPNICCGGVCCTGAGTGGVRACNAASRCATCAEVCPNTCTNCFTLAEGGTVCLDGFSSQGRACSSSAECATANPQFPHCVISGTVRATGAELNVACGSAGEGCCYQTFACT